VNAVAIKALAVSLTISAITAPEAANAANLRLEDRPASGWTQTLNVRLTHGRLGLPADASSRRLARAALARHAGRLGLRRSLRGLRFTRSLRLPSGPASAAPLRSLRFRQTLGGVRVVWSKIDVAVTPRGVSSITATVVPIAPGVPARGHRIGRSRALRIAGRHVRGNEQTLSPQLVAYAGKPTTRAAKRRAARLAYVVEATPARHLGDHSSTPLCVVIDAHSGKVIATWRGHAARRDQKQGRAVAQTTAAAQREEPITTIIIYDAEGASVGTSAPGRRVGGWVTFGDPFVRANWSDVDRTFSSVLGMLNFNMRNVVMHMCFTRFFCSRNGTRDGTWEPFLATGNAGTSGAVFLGPSRVAFSPLTGRTDDIVAHELGHLMDYVYSDDRVTDNPQTR
jgi:hypothetical protein